MKTREQLVEAEKFVIKNGNVIPDIVDDNTFEQLYEKNLLNATELRNIVIRERYKDLRKLKLGQSECIEKINAEFPYLTYDTLRKIIYTII